MITWFAQEQPTSCVAACIRIVLTGFGQQMTEKRIRRALGYSSIGHTLDQACQRMNELGVDATLHNDWSLVDLRDCLRDGWHPIVGVNRQFFGFNVSQHAVVVIGASSQVIQFFDPLGSSTLETASPETFGDAWAGAGQQALVIKSPLSR
jgi:ABC-type bacteriocin/lantibiotic exporter with double-glycine peptidase domain